MATYEVRMPGLQNNANCFEAYNSKLNFYSNKVDSIRSRLYLSSSSSWSIKNSLRLIADGIEDEARSCKNMANGIENISRKYVTTENNICGNSKAVWSGAVGTKENVPDGSGSESPKKDNNSRWDWLPDLIYKPITAALGPFGVLVDGFRRWDEKKYGNVIGDVIKLAGGAVKNWGGSGIKWGDWFGLKPSTKGPWEGAVGKYFDFSDFKKGFSSVCNWATTAITTGFSNFDEHKNFGTRFWGETLTETLIKVGEGIVIGAGVAAVAGATAPGWAVAAGVAAVTVAVDWGLDKVVSWATGGTQTSWIEAASDFVNDTVGGWIDDTRNWLGNTGNRIAGGIRNVGNALCNWRFSLGF